MSKVLDSVINKSVENYKKQDGVEKAIDPALIMVFADLILQFVGAIKGCKSKPEDGAQLMKSPTMLQKVVARRVVRKNLDRADRQHGPAITESLLETGKGISTAEVQALYEEV